VSLQLFNGEALEVMDKLITEGVTVDSIITDVPYQMTACGWDFSLPFNNHLMLPKSSKSKKLVPIYKDEYLLQELKKGRGYKEISEYFDSTSKEGMWQKLNKLIKPDGAVLLFGSEPFSSALRMSNVKNYKYDWIWEKPTATGHLNAKKQPMRAYETISVFYKKQPFYYPIKTKGHTRKVSSAVSRAKSIKRAVGKTKVYGDGIATKVTDYDSTERYPRNVIRFATDRQKSKIHPTQKPVALMEYLVKTYTRESELVLDFTMGSFTTALACLNTKRNFIGIELDDNYFKVGLERLEKHLGTLDYKPKVVYYLK